MVTKHRLETKVPKQSTVASQEEGVGVAAAILCTGGADVIRKEAWPFYRTICGVSLCWELEEPKGPKGLKDVAHFSAQHARSG